jgi:hypothetical protein
MAEAKKMMESKEWQKQMKKMTNSKDFKESVKKTQEMLADPNTAAAAEAKVEHMAKVGNEQLKANAASQMEEAMMAMSNPEVMQQMTQMLKDPKFADQLAAMANDPSFALYKESMEKMLKDPKKKKAIEQNIQKLKQQL